MELIGVIKEELNTDRCSGYDNPHVYIVLDDGTEVLLDVHYLKYNKLLKDFRDKRIRILIEEIKE